MGSFYCRSSSVARWKWIILLLTFSHINLSCCHFCLHCKRPSHLEPGSIAWVCCSMSITAGSKSCLLTHPCINQISCCWQLKSNGLQTVTHGCSLMPTLLVASTAQTLWHFEEPHSLSDRSGWKWICSILRYTSIVGQHVGNARHRKVETFPLTGMA